MKNRDIIREFISGTRKFNACGHIGYTENTLWNYSTVLVILDRENKKADFNARKYSVTTSKIQSMLKYELSAAGYDVNEFIGESARLWNYGYHGAENWKVSDFRI